MKVDRLIRTRRKSIGLTITRDAQLVVRAPHRTPLTEIERLLAEKKAWIRQKLEFFRQHPLPPPKKFVEGEEFLFLGQTYRLRVMEDLPKAVVLDDGLMICETVLKNARDHVLFWYHRQAFEYIKARVDHFAELAGLTYRSVKINNARTHWGSCSFSKQLNFTWRLIMAPPAVVDYVIVHELMHLRHRNHGSKFWDDVAQVMPDYKRHELWFKENSHRLVFNS